MRSSSASERVTARLATKEEQERLSLDAPFGGYGRDPPDLRGK